MFKIEFTDEIETINYTSKRSGKAGTITKTTGYIHGVGKYPEKFNYTSFDGEIKAPGIYNAVPRIKVVNGDLVTDYEFQLVK